MIDIDLGYRGSSLDLIEAARLHLSDIRPSAWTETNRVLTPELSQFPGPFSYSRTPYAREIIDCLSPDSPARWVAVMKGGQIGFSVGVIEGGIGWIIDQNPGPTLLLSGNEVLSQEMMNTRIDQMIEGSGLRPKIRPNVIKKKNQRTGDTATLKEFAGGFLIAGAVGNQNMHRQRSIRYGFIDDFDAIKRGTKDAGSYRTLIEQRFAAFFDTMKLFYISTPQLETESNIKPAFQLGDQRYYNVPCPRCHDHIPLLWSTTVEGETAGIFWKLDNHGKLIPGSVGYICQKCGQFFDDSHKYEMNAAGFWVPTAEASKVGYYSYHVSSLYAPPGMANWAHYVAQYLEAAPPGLPKKEQEYQTFVNVVLGETYEKTGEAPKTTELQKNQQNYEIGTVPEKLSEAHGNGKIVMLTCAADLNGKEADARLDYEIIAWSETGASYSIKHGSIGTFILAESQRKDRVDRERWTYKFDGARSVWTEFTKIRQADYLTDTGRRVKILFTGLDCGQFSEYAYSYIDNTTPIIAGLKGRDDSKNSKYMADYSPFKPAQERANLYLLEVNRYKDQIAGLIKLPFNGSEKQPPEFMNFPNAGGGMYDYKNFFSHYEAEHRIEIPEKGEMRWRKKNSAVYNHMFDCRVYNMAIKDIATDMILKEMKIKHGTWKDVVNIILRKN